MEARSERYFDVDNVRVEAPPPPRIAPEDLYDQLDEFDFSQQLRQVLETNESLRGEISKLKIEVNMVTERCSRIEKENDSLQVNISTLYKTATTELKRKERMYNEVRTELENLKKICNSNLRHVQNTYDRPNPPKSTQPEKAPYQHTKPTLEHGNTNRQQVSESRPKYGERQQSDRLDNNIRNNPYNRQDRKRLRSPSPHRSNRRSPNRRRVEQDRKSNTLRSTSKTRLDRSYIGRQHRSIERQTEVPLKKFNDFTRRDFNEPSHHPRNNNEMVRSRNDDMRSHPHSDNTERREDMNCLRRNHPNEIKTKYIGGLQRTIAERDNRMYENCTENPNRTVYLTEEPIDYNYTDGYGYIKTEEPDSYGSPYLSNRLSVSG